MTQAEKEAKLVVAKAAAWDARDAMEKAKIDLAAAQDKYDGFARLFEKSVFEVVRIEGEKTDGV